MKFGLFFNCQIVVIKSQPRLPIFMGCQVSPPTRARIEVATTHPCLRFQCDGSTEGGGGYEHPQPSIEWRALCDIGGVQLHEALDLCIRCASLRNENSLDSFSELSIRPEVKRVSLGTLERNYVTCKVEKEKIVPSPSQL